ncbi:MAG: flagellar hook-length control protein FliK [Marinomonas sp.]
MQTTVTSPVLPSSLSSSRSAKSADLRSSEFGSATSDYLQPKEKMFAESFQKAKLQGSTKQELLNVSDSEGVVNEKLVSDIPPISYSESSTNIPTISSADSTKIPLLEPKNLVDRLSDNDGSATNKVLSQEYLPSSGNRLQQAGQKTSSTVLLDALGRDRALAGVDHEDDNKHINSPGSSVVDPGTEVISSTVILDHTPGQMRSAEQKKNTDQAIAMGQGGDGGVSPMDADSKGETFNSEENATSLVIPADSSVVDPETEVIPSTVMLDHATGQMRSAEQKKNTDQAIVIGQGSGGGVSPMVVGSKDEAFNSDENATSAVTSNAGLMGKESISNVANDGVDQMDGVASSDIKSASDEAVFNASDRQKGDLLGIDNDSKVPSTALDSKVDESSQTAALGSMMPSSIFNGDVGKVERAGKESAATDNSILSDDLDPEETTELSWVLSQMGAKTPQNNGVSSSVIDQVVANKDALGISPSVNFQSSTKSNDQLSAMNSMITKSPHTLDAQSILSPIGDSSIALSDDDLLANTPIELRKKEQDILIGKMIEPLSGEANSLNSGGLNSAIPTASNNSNRLPPASALNSNASNIQQNLMMSVPPNHPSWAGEMGQKVAWVAQSGGHSAHIKLDPPELGSLTVKVSVDSDNNTTQISFMAATPQTRDLLESQMGRLRDMLAQQGMDLGNVDVGVSQQDTPGGQFQGRNQGEVNGEYNGNLVKDSDDDISASQNISYLSPSGIDYYA